MKQLISYVKRLLKNAKEQKEFLSFVDEETKPIRRQAYLEERKKLALEEGKKLAQEEKGKDYSNYKMDFGVKPEDIPMVDKK